MLHLLQKYSWLVKFKSQDAAESETDAAELFEDSVERTRHAALSVSKGAWDVSIATYVHSGDVRTIKNQQGTSFLYGRDVAKWGLRYDLGLFWVALNFRCNQSCSSMVSYSKTVD